MKQAFASSAALVLLATVAIATEPTEIDVYRTPTCGCCSKWEKHLEDHGFSVVDYVVPNLSAMKVENGITPALASCHTAFVGGYVIEGHVPAADIIRLLETRPAVSRYGNTSSTRRSIDSSSMWCIWNERSLAGSKPAGLFTTRSREKFSINSSGVKCSVLSSSDQPNRAR